MEVPTHTPSWMTSIFCLTCKEGRRGEENICLRMPHIQGKSVEIVSFATFPSELSRIQYNFGGTGGGEGISLKL